MTAPEHGTSRTHAQADLAGAHVSLAPSEEEIPADELLLKRLVCLHENMNGMSATDRLSAFVAAMGTPAGPLGNNGHGAFGMAPGLYHDAALDRLQWLADDFQYRGFDQKQSLPDILLNLVQQARSTTELTILSGQAPDEHGEGGCGIKALPVADRARLNRACAARRVAIDELDNRDYARRMNGGSGPFGAGGNGLY